MLAILVKALSFLKVDPGILIFLEAICSWCLCIMRWVDDIIMLFALVLRDCLVAKPRFFSYAVYSSHCCKWGSCDVSVLVVIRRDGDASV